MTDEILKKICSILPDLYQKNSQKLSKTSKEDWYTKRKKFLTKNGALFKLILENIEKECDYTLTKEELLMMQKLFLMYPEYPPKKLLSMSWNVIQLILNLCDSEKRKFYTDIAYYLELETSELQQFILNDLYDKVLYLIAEIQDYNIVNSESFLEKVIEIQSMVWE